MDKVKRIQYIRNLEAERDKLERQIQALNKNIKGLKDACSHVLVDLGQHEYPSKTRNNYYCLRCGKGKGKGYIYWPGETVFAENYLTNYDVRDEEECDEKFDNIQMLALGILKENPDMLPEEWVTRLNNLIQESISLQEEQNGPQLVK